MANFFKKEGYLVSVITSDIKSNEKWDADLSSLNLYQFPEKMESDYKNPLSRFILTILGKLKYDSMLHRVIRNMAFFLLNLDFDIRLNVNYKALIKDLGEVEAIIATGPPWSVFSYGRTLKKKLPHSPFLVLDYRDPWIPLKKEIQIKAVSHHGLLGGIKKLKMLYLEKKWAKDADLITTISDPIKENIKASAGVKNVLTVTNGFEQYKNTPENILHKEKLHITYTGKINYEQLNNFRIFLSGLSLFLKQKQNIIVKLIGVNVPNYPDVNPFIGEFPEMKGKVYTTTRLSRNESIASQKEAHLFLNLSNHNKNGVYGSKIFEYLSYQKTMLHISRKEDSMTSLIKETKAGYICSTPMEVKEKLILLSGELEENQQISFKGEKGEMDKYNINYQLGKILPYLKK